MNLPKIDFIEWLPKKELKFKNVHAYLLNGSLDRFFNRLILQKRTVVSIENEINKKRQFMEHPLSSSYVWKYGNGT